MIPAFHYSLEPKITLSITNSKIGKAFALIRPHAVRQFSFGPRMCIGKRFADMELLIVMHKMMHNFDLKWVNEDPMTISQVLVNVPDQSLDFQFNDLK